MVFGTTRILENDDEKRAALYGLVKKYFPELEAGEVKVPKKKPLQKTFVKNIRSFSSLLKSLCREKALADGREALKGILLEHNLIGE